MIHVWRLFIGLWLYVLDPVFRRQVKNKRGGNEQVRTGEEVQAVIRSNGHIRRIGG
jgi:hypothetical protein